MDHNGFERQTRHFPATIKINWTNPAWYIAWRDCKNFSPCHWNYFWNMCPKPFSWAKNKRKLFSDGKSRGPPLVRAALNKEESLSLRVYGKFLRRQSYAICKMLRLNLPISVYYFISVSLCLLLLLLLLIFIDLSLPKRSIWFRSSQQWLWLKGLGQRSGSYCHFCT